MRWGKEEDSMGETVTVKLGKAFSKGELESWWEREREIVDLPKLLFDVNGTVATISVNPRHAGKVPIGEIKRPFQIAIHRTYGVTFNIEWLDGPVPSLLFSNRSIFGTEQTSKPTGKL